MGILGAILFAVNGNWSVPDAAIEEFIDALELRLLLELVRACSGCAGDYEDPDRTIWRQAEDPDEFVDPAEGDDG